jgi:sigma-B regulation protein RsbU (phosphoserine phosphatase)
VQRAERLIADLLDFTQARMGGGLSVKLAEVDVHAVIAEGVQEWATAFGGRTIEHRRTGEGRARADAERLVQATGNLVANAVRYGAPGEPITVTTAGLPEGGVEIRVHNRGEPIATEVLPRLFEAMVRGPGASHADGVGLGLYIVRAIMQAHGGTVSAASTAVEGTTFTLSLP